MIFCSDRMLLDINKTKLCAIWY